MKFWKYIFAVLTLILSLVLIAFFGLPDSNVHIIACDVGQGDAILITYKDFQILTDGGPNDAVLKCLSDHMQFWDHKIEVVVLTNPDLDHYGGLISVLKRYKVDYYFKSYVTDSTQSYSVLEKVVGGIDAKVMSPQSGITIKYGLISLDIVHPKQDNIIDFKNAQNNYSTVTLLKYGQFRALLTGDAETQASDYIADEINTGTVDYVKVNHHGSKNGLTKKLLNKLDPKIAVISCGKNNRYNHPSPEIIKMLEEKNVLIKRTDQDGEVEVITNGNDFWLSN